ncbi:MAG: molybdopterin-dependent oxidoreductase [Rhodospirillaceae bacterium]|jgi:thiosulfate reductase / polysulfide reductase chain A|nr:molybdopterin-dependent oxidoreductase [Rhodospirillales bacterium]MBT3904360.1 molybdopterin-dependent oxidoreductase [Rhodospirillaceae bacterium]MBT4701019.1 molybdopterin-dependent oxidoreductase [Rhodospirillaceae bacterium]MBT5033644.1 molybdopterin-dependent oxidoreductase [Rhodospirillaceae bacterium]MBT6221523.1 molybdopterin-dependent oxidoreductase [Rhodospirillaceae bacterium]
MFNRRNFLKLGATSAALPLAGGVSLARAKMLPIMGGKDFSPETGDERQLISSACWQCVTRCPNVNYIEDGRLVKIEGQPNSIRTEGKMCAKGQAGVNQVYDPDRILYPMKRVGKRGEGKWKRISWDDALGEIATRLKKLRDDGHPEKFMFHYGRMKASSSKLIKSVFLANYGTKTIGNHTSICEAGKWTSQELTWGKHYDNWDLDKTNFILNFGSGVLEAHTNHIPVAQRLARAMADRKVKMVTFDVRLSNTAAKSTQWVPVKPGTDLAVILAMSNVIMSEDLYQGDGEKFLKYCLVTPNHKAPVAEKVAALKAHLKQYTPEWAEKISGVSAKVIVDVAREFANAKPGCAISYRGAVGHYNGVETERAVQMLSAITGNIENPGGRCKGVGPSWKYPKGPKKKPKGKALKVTKGFKGKSLFPTHGVSHNVLSVIKDGKAGRPDVYMWYCYSPVYANGNVQENIDIMKDEKLIPFSVCVNPFYDESAALADIILPDATYLERWDYEDMVSPNQVPEYYIRQPVIKPLGEVRDFGDVACELAERMGFPLGFKTKQEFVQISCEKTPAIKALGGFEFMKKAGVWHDPKAKPKYFSHAKALSDKKMKAEGVIYDEDSGTYWNWKKAKAKSEAAAKAKGYRGTKNAYKGYVGVQVEGKAVAGFKPDKLPLSGMFEIYSPLLAAKKKPGLPTWIEVPEHQVMKAGELVLTTYKVAAQIHSRSQNCRWLTEIYHDNPAWINPDTAKALNIKDGDKIMVKSGIGELKTKARVTPAIIPGTVAISHHCGHWEYGRYASGKKAPFGKDDDQDSNIWWASRGAHPNWIIPNDPDPISGALRFQDTVVTVTKA